MTASAPGTSSRSRSTISIGNRPLTFGVTSRTPLPAAWVGAGPKASNGRVSSTFRTRCREPRSPRRPRRMMLRSVRRRSPINAERWIRRKVDHPAPGRRISVSGSGVASEVQAHPSTDAVPGPYRTTGRIVGPHHHRGPSSSSPPEQFEDLNQWLSDFRRLVSHDGRLATSARATATRCICPPDSSAGDARLRSPSPTRSSNSAAGRRGAGGTVDHQRRDTFSTALSMGTRLKNWKTNPRCRRRNAARATLHRHRSRPPTITLPRSGASSPRRHAARSICRPPTDR